VAANLLIKRKELNLEDFGGSKKYVFHQQIFGDSCLGTRILPGAQSGALEETTKKLSSFFVNYRVSASEKRTISETALFRNRTPKRKTNKLNSHTKGKRH
jgi:hypothetical protein